jgi:hypothetical protein
MVLPLTITVVACLAIALMTRPTLMRYVDDVPQPRFLVSAALLSMIAAMIVGGWSLFILCTIGLKNWIA